MPLAVPQVALTPEGLAATTALGAEILTAEVAAQAVASVMVTV